MLLSLLSSEEVSKYVFQISELCRLATLARPESLTSSIFISAAYLFVSCVSCTAQNRTRLKHTCHTQLQLSSDYAIYFLFPISPSSKSFLSSSKQAWEASHHEYAQSPPNHSIFNRNSRNLTVVYFLTPVTHCMPSIASSSHDRTLFSGW